jgi:phosphatidate cytidylyltransferase
MGRTPLSRISPNKTVEGALGGLSFSVLTAMLLSQLFGWPVPLLAAMGLGVAVTFSAVLGDLIESAMKRDAGMKDSGVLIPGHGGLLDRFDSYIFTGAVVYVYIMCLPLFGI